MQMELPPVIDIDALKSQIVQTKEMMRQFVRDHPNVVPWNRKHLPQMASPYPDVQHIYDNHISKVIIDVYEVERALLDKSLHDAVWTPKRTSVFDDFFMALMQMFVSPTKNPAIWHNLVRLMDIFLNAGYQPTINDAFDLASSVNRSQGFGAWDPVLLSAFCRIVTRVSDHLRLKEVEEKTEKVKVVLAFIQ